MKPPLINALALRKLAWDAIRRGWRVIPLHFPMPDGHCTCKDGKACKTPGKHPKVKWKELADIEPTKAEVEQWFRGLYPFNLGILTGKPSNLVAIDIDARHGGDESIAKLENDHGQLPATVEQVSGSGSRHLLYRWPGTKVKTSIGQIAPGIDVRGDGGLLVVEPSVHPSGGIYRWDVGSHPDELEPAPMPEWLIKACNAKRVNPGASSAIQVDPAPITPSPSHIEGFPPVSYRVAERPEATECQRILKQCSVTPILRHSVVSVAVRDLAHAIELTTPKRVGERHHHAFEFARAVKAFHPDAPDHILRDYVRAWYARAVQFNPNRDIDETMADFMISWPKIHTPLGSGADYESLRVADAMQMPECARKYDTPWMHRLVKWCKASHAAAIAAGEDRFYLSSRKAAEMLGGPHTAANSKIHLLVIDKIIVPVEKWTTKRAARFQYTGD